MCVLDGRLMWKVLDPREGPVLAERRRELQRQHDALVARLQPLLDRRAQLMP